MHDTCQSDTSPADTCHDERVTFSVFPGPEGGDQALAHREQDAGGRSVVIDLRRAVPRTAAVVALIDRRPQRQGARCRGPRHRRRRRRSMKPAVSGSTFRAARCSAALALVITVGLSSCSGDAASKSRTIAQADHPVALTLANDDTLIYAERLTGRVMRLDLDRTAEPTMVGQVEVDSSGEQRGLIGLAIINDHVYGTWTRPGDLRLVVGEIAVPVRVVWEGPVSATKADSGHLAVLDGRLVVGLGELVKDSELAGTLVSLDPAGGPDQVPTVLSHGWHNPFAFAVEEQGRIWVADNAPDGVAERLGRGDIDGQVSEFAGVPQRAPSALVVFADGRLGVCGYLDGEMRRYSASTTSDGSIASGVASAVASTSGGGTTSGVAAVSVGTTLTVEREGTVVKAGCRTGAVVRPNGDVIVADDTTLTLVAGG